MPTLDRPSFKQRDILRSLIVSLLQLEVFFIPVVFLPFTFEIFEFGKQNLLWFLTLAALVLWLGKVFITDKQITYKKTPLDIPIVIVLVLWGLSAVLSVDWFSSFFGYYGRFSDAYLSTLSFGIFYFLAVNVLTFRDTLRFFNTFLLSAGVVLSAGLLAMFGLWSKMFAWEGRMSVMNASSFNPLGGSAESLALFAAVVLTLVVALYSYHIKGARRARALDIKYFALGFLALAVLGAVNFLQAWAVALTGLALLFMTALYLVYVGRQAQDSIIDISIAPALSLFAVALVFVFLFTGSGSLFGLSLPREVTLSAPHARTIVWGGVKQNPVLGSGPGMFSYVFSAHRPSLFNQDQFWQLRFDKAPAHLLELMSTVGLAGWLSYAALIGVFVYVSFVFIRNMFRAPTEESYMAFGFSFAVFSLALAQAVYIANTALLFAFWLALALAMVSWRLAFDKIFSTADIDLAKYRDVAAIVSIMVITGIGLFLGFTYVQAKYYVADVYYNNFRLSGNQAFLERAVALNERRVNYRLALARHYLGQSYEDIASLSTPDAASLPAENKNRLQDNIQKAITAGEAATRLAPNAVMSWELLGAIYRDVRFIAVGSVEPAIRYFEKAGSLEPTNPVLLTELGSLYASHNQTNEAVAVLERAIAYKSNYLPAHIALAKTYETLSQPDKALLVLEEVIRQAPNAEVVYESGRLYYNQNKLDTAIDRFSRAVSLRPGYANAMYSLGLAYQKKGDSQRALEQFEKVLALNPGNEAVADMIEEIRKLGN